MKKALVLAAEKGSDHSVDMTTLNAEELDAAAALLELAGFTTTLEDELAATEEELAADTEELAAAALDELVDVSPVPLTEVVSFPAPACSRALPFTRAVGRGVNA